MTPKDQVLPRLEEHREKEEDKQRFYGFMEWRQCSAEGYSRDTRRDVVIDDTVALIYISGTTGFPKAAVMDHGRCACKFFYFRRLKRMRKVELPIFMIRNTNLGENRWQQVFGQESARSRKRTVPTTVCHCTIRLQVKCPNMLASYVYSSW